MLFFKNTFLTCLLLALLALRLPAAESTDLAHLVRVAYDCPGTAELSHLQAGDIYTRKLKADEKLDAAFLSCVFSDKVVFGYTGLKPGANYRARIHFLADAPRTLKIKAGDQGIVESLALEKDKVLESVIEIPKAAYCKDTLELSFKQISGANALVLDIWLLSI